MRFSISISHTLTPLLLLGAPVFALKEALYDGTRS